ncbi:MAG TPA: chorismate mutase [Firmicutes bacterium]|nr:chorismate mutase [Candidatus Fermentithermobacillaceae bacterium]
MIRGIRGATTASSNSREDILEAGKELLQELISHNSIDSQDIACIIFSSTPDLKSAYPAAAARKLGLLDVPLFGAQEIDVKDCPAKCIRILVLLNTQKSQREISHVYLREASALRPDLAQNHSRKGEIKHDSCNERQSITQGTG